MSYIYPIYFLVAWSALYKSDTKAWALNIYKVRFFSLADGSGNCSLNDVGNDGLFFLDLDDHSWVSNYWEVDKVSIFQDNT